MEISLLFACLLGAVLVVMSDSSRQEGPAIPFPDTPGVDNLSLNKFYHAVRALCMGWELLSMMDDS